MAVRWIAFSEDRNIADLDLIDSPSRATPLRSQRAPCVAVVVENALTNRDGSANGVSVWIGDAANQPWELQPGQSTDRIPVSGAEQVFIRGSAPDTLPPDPLPDEFFMLLFNRVTVREEV